MRFLALLLPLVLVAAEVAPPVLAVPHLAQAPRLDGDPADPAWKAAALIPALTSSILPEEERRSLPATTVQVGWDSSFLYLRWRCTDNELYLPVKGRDADLYRGDAAELFLDPVGDGRAVMELQISPAGDLFDQTLLLTAPADDRGNGLLSQAVLDRDFWDNRAWNLEGIRFQVRQLENGSGWIVDLGVPPTALRRLGLKAWQAMDVRANIMRYEWPLAAKRELLAMNWSPVAHGCPHISPTRMGTLRLMP